MITLSLRRLVYQDFGLKRNRNLDMNGISIFVSLDDLKLTFQCLLKVDDNLPRLNHRGFFAVVRDFQR
jgi:hypothetical protein